MKYICDLKITIEANKKVVNFLDITLDLNTEKFKPYSKPSNTPRYVHSKSNHPPNIMLTEGSQKFYPTKPCLTKLQARVRMHCTRVGTHINWSLNHRKGTYPKDVIDPGNYLVQSAV